MTKSSKRTFTLEAGVKEYITVNPSERIIKTYIDKNYLKLKRQVLPDADDAGGIKKTETNALTLSALNIQTIETDTSNAGGLFINTLNLSIPLNDIFEPDSEYQLKDDDEE